MLWELTWNLIATDGFDPVMINGTAGNNIALQLVNEGMMMQPCSPGFVDGRNAILDADTALFGGAHGCQIWEAFSKRGLGLSASQGSNLSRSDGSEAFDMPATACNVAFPVEWLSFIATPNDASISLAWEVEQLSDNQGFILERKIAELGKFEEVAFISANPALTGLQSFEYEDRNVSLADRYYYRLKQIDMDGTSQYSSIVEAQLFSRGTFDLSLFPNPSTGLVTLELPRMAESGLKIVLVNTIGQIVHHETLPAGNSRFELDLSRMEPGVYAIRIMLNGKQVVRQLVIE